MNPEYVYNPETGQIAPQHEVYKVGANTSEWEDYMAVDRSTSGWGNAGHSHGLQPSPWKPVDRLTEEQLSDLLKQLSGKRKKDQFDIEDLSAKEAEELKNEVKEIIKKKG